MRLCPKYKPVRSENYKKFIRNKTCIVCGQFPCEAAHSNEIGGSAMGSKDSDLSCVSLCWECHRRQHQKGWASLGLDAHFLINRVLQNIEEFVSSGGKF